MSTTLEAPPVLTIRQSHLRALEEQCPAMARSLAVDHREGPSFTGAMRGTVIHTVFARYTEHLWQSGRPTDFEAAETIARQVLAEYPGCTLRYAEREDVLSQARTIADTFLFEPAHYYGSEEALQADIPLPDGQVVRITGRLDLLEVLEEGTLGRITDVKSNHQVPADSAIQQDFQLRTYALMVVESLPEVEAVEGRLWFTRYGRYVPQHEPAVWTREELLDFRDHLANRLMAFLDGDLSHEFVPGSWCQYCPRRRPGDCTHWRAYYGTVPPTPLTPHQAVRLARQVVTLEQAREDRLALLKGYVNEHGPLRLGSGCKAETFAFRASESTDYPAEEFLAVLDEFGSLVGDQPVGKLLTVNKRSREFKALTKVPEIRLRLADIAETSTRTTFGHKGVGDD